MVDLIVSIVGAFVVMVLGTFWYSPLLFGKTWIKLSGFTPEMMATAKAKGMGKTYALAFVNALVLSAAVNFFIGYSDALTYGEAIVVGGLLWLGFIVTTLVSGMLWESKPFYLIVINAVYYLAAISVLSLISFTAFEWFV